MKKVKLHEVADINKSNFDFTKVNRVFYLDTSNVVDGNFIELQKFDEKEYSSLPSRAKRAVKKGTTVISTVRPNLKHYGYFADNSCDVVVSTGFATVDGKKEKIDSRYLYYILSSIHTTNYLVAMATTSTSSYPSYTPDILKNMEIEIVSDLPTQQRIAKVLSTIDAKIANNNAICAELEAMAKQLYDYWFVQFDFPDKNGKPYKSSGGKMVYNETLKREIPEGWEVGNLKQCIKHVNTGLNPRNNFVLGNGKIKYVTVKNITENSLLDFTNCDTIDEIARKKVHNRSDIQIGDILFASIAPLGRCYLVKDEPSDWDINESVFSIRPNIAVVSSEYLLMCLTDEYFIKKATNSAEGSIFSGIRINTLENMPILLPSKNILKNFSLQLRLLLGKKELCFKEDIQLIALRDFLLPMLMNGQVEVKA